MKNRTLYFAYGANTNPGSMAARCPDAIPTATMSLKGARLVFRGVADVVADETSVVKGVLWWLTRRCEEALDRFEGFPNWYTKEYVPVELGGKTHDCMVYVMTSQNPREVSPPPMGYEECLREGYYHFGLPLAQIDRAIDHARRHRPRPVVRTTRACDLRHRGGLLLPGWAD